MVVMVGEKVSKEDLKSAAEDYFGEYIKIVVDIETEMIAIGGEWHADGERQLLNAGCQQANLWGGGLDLIKNQINYSAMTNIKPLVNKTHVIEDSKLRGIFDNIIKQKFGL